MTEGKVRISPGEAAKPGRDKRKNKNMPYGSYRIGAEGGKVKITDKNIESRIEEINKELEKIRKVEKKFPQGELQCFKNENRYKWKIKEENGLHYLPKTERNQAEMLAMKKYYECRKKELVKSKFVCTFIFQLC